MCECRSGTGIRVRRAPSAYRCGSGLLYRSRAWRLTFHCGINTSRRALLGAARMEADASMMRAPEADRSRPACIAPSFPRTRALCPAQKATTDPLLLLESVESPREKLPDECNGVIPPGSFSDTTFPRCACSTRRHRRLGIGPGLEATAWMYCFNSH
jgi:hypothetical protein